MFNLIIYLLTNFIPYGILGIPPIFVIFSVIIDSAFLYFDGLRYITIVCWGIEIGLYLYSWWIDYKTREWRD